MFGPGISDALPYDTMAQAPYPPPAATSMDGMGARDTANSRKILSEPSLLSFLASKQQKTLGILTGGVRHPATFLIQPCV